MNVAGYWVETVIFGGPILFSRGSEGGKVRVSGSEESPTFLLVQVVVADAD